MRKGRDGEKKGEKMEEKKVMMFLVATNVVASRPSERRPTGTPHARANRPPIHASLDNFTKELSFSFLLFLSAKEILVEKHNCPFQVFSNQWRWIESKRGGGFIRGQDVDCDCRVFMTESAHLRTCAKKMATKHPKKENFLN